VSALSLSSLESELSSVSSVSPRLWRCSVVIDAVQRASPPAWSSSAF
jgi:hypothetical protein